MRILFIRTGINLEDPVFYSMGVASISAVIKKAGHETSFFYLEKWEMLNALYHRIDTFKPDVIGFSSPSCSLNIFVKLSDLIKKRNPKIFQILGGPVTLCPEETTKSGSFDAISLGEGEYSLLETLEKFKTSKKWYEGIKGMWFKVDGKIIKNPYRGMTTNLDELPDPDWEIFLKENCLFAKTDYGDGTRMSFMMARGCPFDCAYCANTSIKKFYGCNNVRHLSVKRSIDQIKKARALYRVDYVGFDDDILTYDRDWSIEFLTRYKKEIGLPFECNVRVGPFASKEMLTLLKQAGCVEVKFGVESGNQEIRDKILNRKMSNKQIIEVTHAANKLGLKTTGNVMMGLPEESPKEFRDTIELLAVLNLSRYLLFVFRPYKGTVLYDYCIKKGYFDTSREDVLEWRDTPLNLPTFKRKDILYFYKNLYKILEFRKPQKSKLKRFYRLIYYQLYLVYPSHVLYPVARVGLFILKAPVLFFRSIIDAAKG